jgi:hypothetical protein
MNKVIVLLAALILAACASTAEQDTADEAINEQDPVQDFLRLHELEKVTVVRGFENPSVLIMDDPTYIIAYQRNDQWLIQYEHECRFARQESGYRPNDKRRSTRALYVQQDTFRGCPVKAMYPISLEQAKELLTIAKDPGSS